MYPCSEEIESVLRVYSVHSTLDALLPISWEIPVPFVRLSHACSSKNLLVELTSQEDEQLGFEYSLLHY